jgi:hypothetical protein
MRHLILAPLVVVPLVAVVVAVGASSCGQPPVSCTVSTFVGYAAKYQLVEGTGSCAERSGDVLGLAAYNPAKKDQYDNTVPNLDAVSLAIRSATLGGLHAFALDEGVVDTTEGNKPHAFGPFTSAFPQNDICTAELEPARVDLPAIELDPEQDPEDPDDDIEQDAVAQGEAWSDVQVYVTAANLGTQMKGRYTVTDDAEGCSATYDVLAVFPAVFCEDIVSQGDPIDIVSIDDDSPDPTDASGETLLVRVVTAAPHGLVEDDTIEIAGVDDDELSFDGTYTVGEVVNATTFITAEIDPFDGDDPDPAGTDVGTVQKLVSQANPSYCSPVAIPEEGIAVGSGISPDFPVVCDPELLMCVLNANPSEASLPVLQAAE